jgi:hypothetical protein
MKNRNGVSAIDMVIEEDFRTVLRDIRHYFREQAKYRDIDFSHHN